MKMKRLVALVAAGVLCLSMSMTAFATEAGKDNSPQNPPKPEEKQNAGLGEIADMWVPSELKDDLSVTTLEGAKKDLTDAQYKEVVDTFTSPEKIENIIKDQCNLPADVECTVLVAGDIKFSGDKFPAEGIDLDVNVGSASANGLKDGDSIYVLHYTKNGTWEVLQGTVKLDGDSAYVSVHFNSLSPVAFVKVMSNGKIVPYDAKGNPITSAKTTKSSKVVSPKTGE